MDRTERELRDMLADRRLKLWPTEPQWNAIWLAANARGFQGTVSRAVHAVAPELLHPDWIDMMDVDPAEARTLWAEICVRNSVSPFVEESTPYTDAQKAEVAFKAELKQRLAQGWKVVSNGPDGMELRSPKRLRRRDLVCLILGVLTLVAYGFGLLRIAFALIDHFGYNHPESVFLVRSGHAKPAR